MNRAIAVLPALVPIPMPVGLMPGMKIPRIPFPLYLWRVTVWTVPQCSRWAGSFTSRVAGVSAGAPGGSLKKVWRGCSCRLPGASGSRVGSAPLWSGGRSLRDGGKRSGRRVIPQQRAGAYDVTVDCTVGGLDHEYVRIIWIIAEYQPLRLIPGD